MGWDLLVILIVPFAAGVVSWWAPVDGRPIGHGGERGAHLCLGRLARADEDHHGSCGVAASRRAVGRVPGSGGVPLCRHGDLRRRLCPASRRRRRRGALQPPVLRRSQSLRVVDGHGSPRQRAGAAVGGDRGHHCHLGPVGRDRRHRRRHRGSLEVRAHRLDGTRHRAARDHRHVLRGELGLRQRVRALLPEAPRRGRAFPRPGGPPLLRARGARLRHQDGARPGAHLAPRRPLRGAHPRSRRSCRGRSWRSASTPSCVSTK